MQIRRLTAGVVLAIVWPGTLLAAEPLDDCRRAPRPEARLAGCSGVIASPAASAPDRATAYRLRGELRAQAGALAEADSDLTEALKLDPRAAAALVTRAEVRLRQANAAGAVQDFDDALRLTPGRFQIRLGRGHARMMAGDLDGAIADLTEAMRIDPKSASAVNNRGLAHRRKGDLDRAHQDYTQALQLNPVFAQAYANRGYLEAARGRTEQAVSDLRAALLLDPSLTGARDALARLGKADSWVGDSERHIARGKALAETHCSSCHAVGTSGRSPNEKAPEFRRMHERHPLIALREPLTRGIAAPHDQMPRFVLHENEIDSLIAYVNSLSGGR